MNFYSTVDAWHPKCVVFVFIFRMYFIRRIWDYENAYCLFTCSADARSATGMIFYVKGAGGGSRGRNCLYDVFLKWRLGCTSCFLLHQKILIPAEVMVGRRSALICNSIARAIFNRIYLEILILWISKSISSHIFWAITFILGSYVLWTN